MLFRSPLYESALAISEVNLSRDHGDVAQLLHNLGVVERKLGNLDQAKSAFMRALAIRERLFGMSAPIVADTLEALAMTVKDAGEEGASSMYRQRAEAIRAQAK